jgi:spore coat polysaccharide biosynthesis predicted glycosyltransferase SpsG
MRILLRADAGSTQGSGHVMRCLTLAEGLQSRGHRVELITAPIDLPWLAQVVAASALPVHHCEPDDLATDLIRRLEPDWVVVDSYEFAPASVSELNGSVPVLALIDGNDRGIDAELYLDHNLGAERKVRDPRRQLFGSRFALVRDEVVEQRRPTPWKFQSARPQALSVMGGSDPTHASALVSEAIGNLGSPVDLTIIAPEHDHDEVRRTFRPGYTPELLAPTARLPQLLARADLVISAAGTSAWDICALGIPAVLLAVVDNQQESLDQAVSSELTLGIDAVGDPSAIVRKLTQLVAELTTNEDRRMHMSVRCRTVVDGNGKLRVSQRLESYRGQGGSTERLVRREGND